MLVNIITIAFGILLAFFILIVVLDAAASQPRQSSYYRIEPPVYSDAVKAEHARWEAESAAIAARRAAQRETRLRKAHALEVKLKAEQEFFQRLAWRAKAAAEVAQ